MRYNIWEEDGASSNRNSRRNFSIKKDIRTLDGHLIPKGTKVTNIIEIAGGKRKRKIDDISLLVNEFGGEPKKWSKRRGTIVIEGKKEEIHYYQNDKVGKVKFKIKKKGNKK